MDVAIVGAGISGLATAFYLKRQQPSWRLKVFDAGGEAGGTMRTVNLQGFLFETGSNGFLTNKPYTLQLVKDSGAEHLLLPSSDEARKRYIFNGRLHRLPETPPAFVKTPLLSFGQKLRVLGEVFVPARRDPGEETLQQFGYRRVGKAFTDVFLDAMVAGVFASTPDKISVNAAFPLVVQLEREHGGLFRGMLARRKKQAGPGGVLTSFIGGVSSFIEHLVTTIDAEWHLGEAVQRIERSDSGFLLASERAEYRLDRVALAAPAYAAAAMLAELDPVLAEGLQAIEYSPIAVVGFGYDALSQPLDGFGLLTTSSAGEKILGVLWDSSIFSDRAPAGKQSVRVMIGGQRNPELALLPEEELIAIAREGLARTMALSAEPVVTFFQRWARGIPNYRVGHIGHVDRLCDRAERLDGLFLCSNAYRGIALNDCVANARQVASAMAHRG